MNQDAQEIKFGGTRDAAVRAKTGKGWLEWFDILEAAGAVDMSHKEIVAILKGYPEVNAWWQQKITGTFEVERGGRRKHQMEGGFEISRSRTVAAPVTALFDAFLNAESRQSWLGVEVPDVRETKPGRQLWMTWADGTRVGASFSDKGPAKSSVTVQHTKLPDAAAAEEMKAFWSAKLAALKERL